jgi:hypothetical protein
MRLSRPLAKVDPRPIDRLFIEGAKPIPSREDPGRVAYHIDDAQRLRVLFQADFFTPFRGSLGKASPVHLFGASFDHAVTRFFRAHGGGAPGRPS